MHRHMMSFPKDVSQAHAARENVPNSVRALERNYWTRLIGNLSNFSFQCYSRGTLNAAAVAPKRPV